MAAPDGRRRGHDISPNVEGLPRTPDGAGPAECDRDRTDHVLAWLEAGYDLRPCFSLLSYDAPHAYDLPRGFPRELQPSREQVDDLAPDARTDPEPFHELHRNALRWTDHQAGRAIDALRARGLLERSSVLVTGDHGQELNDLGLACWGTARTCALPLARAAVLRRPGLAPRDVGHRTTHFDVAAALRADALVCRTDPGVHCVGRSLFDPADGGVLTTAAYSHCAAERPGERHGIGRHSGEIEVLGPDDRTVEWPPSDAEFLRESFLQRARFRPNAGAPGP